MMQDPVYKLSWSVTGHILAVSDGTNGQTLWKEAADKKWQKISTWPCHILLKNITVKAQDLGGWNMLF